MRALFQTLLLLALCTAFSTEAQGRRTDSYGAAMIARTYDALNRLGTYNDGRGHALGYGYDANGSLTSLTYEPGKTVTYTYDNRNRLTGIADWTGRNTALAYDGASRLLSVTRANGTVRTNTWDDASQLVNVMDRHTASGKPVLAIKLGYDLGGRLTNKFEVPAWGGLPPLPARGATYNIDNQIATFAGQPVGHDDDGNTTSAPAVNGSFAPLPYAWNQRNQLTNAPGGLAYGYDADGLRTGYAQGGQTTTFVNDPRGAMSRVLWRIRPDGTRTFYIYGPVLLYEIEETGNAARYYHYDHLGSTLALSNDAGQVAGRASYSAYGITLQTSGTLGTPFLWQGAFGVQTDPTGLHYMRARYYHAWLGRFLSEDPLGLAAGSNVYAYCNGNPVSLSDPLGLCAEGSGSGNTGGGPPEGYPASFAADAARIEYINSKAYAADAALFMSEGEKTVVELANAASALVAGLALPEAGPLLRSLGGVRVGGVSARTAGQLALPAPSVVPNAGGVIRSFIQKTDQIYYRVSSGNPSGSFLTAVKPSSSAWAREALALPEQNTASFIQEVLVPAGTRLQRSRALPAFGRRGGAEQFEILKLKPGEYQPVQFGENIPLQ